MKLLSPQKEEEAVQDEEEDLDNKNESAVEKWQTSCEVISPLVTSRIIKTLAFPVRRQLCWMFWTVHIERMLLLV